MRAGAASRSCWCSCEMHMLRGCRDQCTATELQLSARRLRQDWDMMLVRCGE
jgi:hypothetical protein